MQDYNKVVLVGVVNRKKDLKIILNEKWYRIPVKYAPKKKAKFLAIYQTKIFGEEGKAINYYADIKSWSIFPRKELLPDEKEHPKAEQLYYKIQLGPIKKLPKRIKNTSRRRISFGFTTIEKLLKSKEVSQLFDIPPIELIMGKILKKNNIKAIKEYLFAKNRKRYFLDFAIFCKKGKIDLECDNEKWHSLSIQRKKDKERDVYLKKCGWIVLRFPGKEIITNPANCVKTLKKTINKLGGLKMLTHKSTNGKTI